MTSMVGRGPLFAARVSTQGGVPVPFCEPFHSPHGTSFFPEDFWALPAGTKPEDQGPQALLPLQTPRREFFLAERIPLPPPWVCFFFFWPCGMACWILAPQPGMEPISPAVEPRVWNRQGNPPSVFFFQASQLLPALPSLNFLFFTYLPSSLRSTRALVILLCPDLPRGSETPNQLITTKWGEEREGEREGNMN